MPSRHLTTRMLAAMVVVLAAVSGSGCGSDPARPDAGAPEEAATGSQPTLEAPTTAPPDLAPGGDTVAPGCLEATRALLEEVVPALRPVGEALPPITSGEQLGEAVLGLLFANVLPQTVASDPTIECASDLEYARALVAELAALDATEGEQVADLAHGVFSIGCNAPEEADLSPEATGELCEAIDARFAARGIDLDPQP